MRKDLCPVEEETQKQAFLARLQGLEPYLHEAGQLALELQRCPAIEKVEKSKTGKEARDIMTSADPQVQDLFLDRVLATGGLPLCRLYPEEISMNTYFFLRDDDPPGDAGLDPINRTSEWWENKSPFFNLVLHARWQGTPLYSIVHHPALAWTYRIVDRTVSESGRRPRLNLPADWDPQRTVVHYACDDPATEAPSLCRDLRDQGYRVLSSRCAGSYGSLILFLCRAAGIIIINPSIVDGLVAYHDCLADPDTLRLETQDGTDLSRRDLVEPTWHIPGAYAVMIR